MADEAGTEVEATDTGATTRAQSRAERDAANRAEILAGWDDEIPDPRPAQARKPASAGEKPRPKPAAAAREAELEPDDDDVEPDDDEVELEDLAENGDGEDGDELAAGGANADTSKRLEQVSKAEKRARARVAAERQSFERERDAFMAEWKPKIEKYQQFEKQLARGSSDPLAMAEAFGYTEDDFEDLAKIFHGHSKAAATDPKWKAHARQLQQERGVRKELAELRASHEKLTGELTQEREQRDQVARRDEYLGKVARAANDSTPLLKKDLETRGQATKEALRRLALAIAERDGETPDPKKVAALYERRRRAGLERDKGMYDFLKPAAAAGGKPTPAPKRSAIAVVDRSGDARATADDEKPTTKRRSLIPSRNDFLRDMLNAEDTD